VLNDKLKRNRRGGHNRLTPQEHARRGTYRRDRHGPLTQRFDRKGEPIVESETISDRDADALLDGLPEGDREVAEALLFGYWWWPEDRRVALIALSRSHARLERLEAARRPNTAAIVAERANVSAFLQLLGFTPQDLAEARETLREAYRKMEA
jgi:hypothetical protein